MVTARQLSPHSRFAADRKRNAAGFTLVEAMVVVSIIAILASLAAPSFSDFIASQRAKAVATDLYIALMKARSEAVKRNTNVTLSQKTGGWQNGWQIPDPSNASIILEDHGAIKGVTISTQANITYQSSGRVQGTSAPSFTITASGASRCVSVDLSGRPYVKASSC